MDLFTQLHTYLSNLITNLKYVRLLHSIFIDLLPPGKKKGWQRFILPQFEKWAVGSLRRALLFCSSSNTVTVTIFAIRKAFSDFLKLSRCF